MFTCVERMSSMSKTEHLEAKYETLNYLAFLWASGKVPIFVINLDAVTDSKLGVGFEEWGGRQEGGRRGGGDRLFPPSLLSSLHLSPLNACYQNIQFRALHSGPPRSRSAEDPRPDLD